MRFHVRQLAAGLLTLAFIGGALPASSHEPKKHDNVANRVMPDGGVDAKAREYFTDSVLLTHESEPLRFYSDVLAGRTVVVNFMFTSCKDACPMINHQLMQVADQLNGRLGKDIFFVSVSVDPEVDTPAVMADYRAKLEAPDGWYFLTGDAEALELVGGRMGQVFDKDAHLTALLVGNTKTGRWRKLPAYFAPASLAAQMLEIADAGAE